MVRKTHTAFFLSLCLLLGACGGGGGDDDNKEEVPRELESHAPFTDEATLEKLNESYKKLIQDQSPAASIRPRVLMTVVSEEVLDDPEEGPNIAQRGGFTYTPGMTVVTLYTPQGWVVMPKPAMGTLEPGMVVEVDMPSANDIGEDKSTSQVASRLRELLDSGSIGIVASAPACQGKNYMELGYTVTCQGVVASYQGNAAEFPAGSMDWLSKRSVQDDYGGSGDDQDDKPVRPPNDPPM